MYNFINTNLALAGGVVCVVLIALVLSGCVQGDRARFVGIDIQNNADNNSTIASENTLDTATTITPNISPTVPVGIGPF